MNKFLKAAGQGIKQNIFPAIILQIIAIGIVLTYYFVTPTRFLFNFVASLKQNNGIIFSSLSTAVFAGLIPCLYLLFSGKIEKGQRIKTFLFLIIFWAYKGIEVDLLYRLQGVIFGTSPNFFVVLKKVIIDQFVYNIIWAAPGQTLAYLFKDVNFSFKSFKKEINKELFIIKIPSLLVSTWIVWIPAVSVIYCFPSSLQIPIFNIVVCFWSLFLNVFTGIQNKSDERIHIPEHYN